MKLTLLIFCRCNHLPETVKHAVFLIRQLFDIQMVPGTCLPTHSNSTSCLSQPPNHYSVQKDLCKEKNYDRWAYQKLF